MDCIGYTLLSMPDDTGEPPISVVNPLYPNKQSGRCADT